MDRIWTLALLIGLALPGVFSTLCTRTNIYGHVETLYCPTLCCGTSYNEYCCHSSIGAIIGGVLGFLFLVAVVVSIVTCCCCSCCPVYQYRSTGLVYSTRSSSNSSTERIYTPGTTYVYTDSTPNTEPYPDTKPYPGGKPAGAYTSQPPPYHP